MLIILLFHHLEHLESLRERHAYQLNSWVGCNLDCLQHVGTNFNVVLPHFILYLVIYWIYCKKHVHKLHQSSLEQKHFPF